MAAGRDGQTWHANRAHPAPVGKRPKETDAKARRIAHLICREMLNGHVGTHSTATAQAVFAAKAPKIFGAKSSFRRQKIVILTHHLWGEN